jgi:hypothetical protein
VSSDVVRGDLISPRTKLKLKLIFSCNFVSDSHETLLNVAAFTHSENITVTYRESSFPCNFPLLDVTAHATI